MNSFINSVLQLCRIPNVFTSMSNVVAGVVLARGGEFRLSDMRVVLASALLYIAGMVLNDFFDRKIDAIERPSRPIPSGRISASGALLFGVVLIIGAGVLLAPLSCTVQAVGVALTLAILLYDTWLKNTPMGVISMGLCRTLNVLLGFAIVPWPTTWMWVLPIGLGIYTAAITYLARDEVIGQSLKRCASAAYFMLFLYVAFVAYLSALSPAQEMHTFLLALPFLLFVGYRGLGLFRPLLSDFSGPTVGRAIGGGILLMPGIDAAVLACAGYPLWALVALALRFPSMWLKRRYYMT